jgi:hypothetical protein
LPQSMLLIRNSGSKQQDNDCENECECFEKQAAG